MNPELHHRLRPYDLIRRDANASLAGDLTRAFAISRFS
jgi:hypothetical protein